MKKERSKNIRFSLLVAIAASVSVILYPMFMFLINNQDEFWFNITEMLLPAAILTLAVAVVLFLLLVVVSGRKSSWIMLLIGSMLTAASICYYVQSNYMISYLPLLTGDEIDWSSYGKWSLLSLLLWIGIPAVMLVLFFVKRKAMQTIVMGCCACVLGMEILVLGMTYASTPINAPEDNAAYFSKEGLYELSTEKNVVVMVSDTFQGTFMNEILETYPEWKEKLSDFTYFDNTTGTSCFTYFSFAKLLTGVDFPIGEDSADGVKYAFQNQTIIDTVAENGYDIAYYTVFKPTSNVQDKVLNYEGDILKPDQQAKQTILKLLMKSTLFQGVPHQLKEHFVVMTTDYSNVQASIETGDKAAPYVINDVAYRESLLSKGLAARDTKPRYVVHELFGVHAPYTINRDFESVQFSEETTVREKQIEASLAALKLLVEYTDKLKEANLYDQTTIIFTADHGFDLRFYPVMLVKEANVSGTELVLNSVPLSQQEDLATLLDGLTSGKTFAESVEALNLKEDRIRYALDFRSADGYGKDTNMRSRVQIVGHASKKDSYQVVNDEYSLRETFEGRYTVGDAVVHADSSSNVAMYGFRSDNQYMYAHSAVMDVWFKDDINTTLEYTAKVTNVTGSMQVLKVLIAGKEAAKLQLEPGETKELSVSISPDLVMDKRITVRFEAPNASTYHEAGEALAWNEYHSFKFLEGSIR